MVAAWINAETGVGPAIASGNHVNSGNCADFPVAPMNNPKVATDKIATEVPKFSNSNRSEEHTSELQSRENLVCRLLLEKKKVFFNILKILVSFVQHLFF